MATNGNGREYASDTNTLIRQAQRARRIADLAERRTTDTKRDLSLQVSGAAPNFGNYVLPHIMTFQGLVSNLAKVYRNPDEAYRNSWHNARAMRNDLTVMECLEARQRMTALLNWHIEVEDEHLEEHKDLADKLTKILERTPRFVELRRCLLEAIWYGKAGVQLSYGWQWFDDRRQYCGISAWEPVNGDKLVFRYDDRTHQFDPDQIGIRVAGAYLVKLSDEQKSQVMPTDQGMAYFLERHEMKNLVVHKHYIEDAAFEDPFSAGSLHGLGLRSRIYWTWVQKQETLSWLMEYLERIGQGFTVWTYESGNPESERKTREAAEKQTGQNIILVPVEPGDDPQSKLFRIEPNASGIDSIKQIVHEYFGHLIKRYMLGQILSTESDATGLGSGVADLHLDSLMQIVGYDSRNLEETVTCQLLRYIKDLNFPAARNVHARFVIDTEKPEAAQRLEAIGRAFEMGLKIRAEDVRQVVGLSKPADGDEILEQAAPAPAVSPFGVDPSGGLPGVEPPNLPDSTNPPGEKPTEAQAA